MSKVFKGFAFRCEWKTKEGDQDGFSYAISKQNLINEIQRRSHQSGDLAGAIRVVPVGIGLCNTIGTQPNKVYSTNLYKHELDLEIKHTGESYVTKVKKLLKRNLTRSEAEWV